MRKQGWGVEVEKERKSYKDERRWKGGRMRRVKSRRVERGEDEVDGKEIKRERRRKEDE